MSIYGPINADDLEILRSSGTHAVNRYLTVIPQKIMMTAQINQLSFVYPCAQITVDNVSLGAGYTLADISHGNDIWIGTAPGGRDVFVGRIRNTPTMTTIYIEEISAGVSGVPQTYYREIQDNHYVTIVTARSIWSMYPRFENIGGDYVIRKDWSVAYVNQNAYPSPIANITPITGRPVGFVNPNTGKYRITITSANTIALLDGNAISSVVWDIGAGSLTSGTLVSETITVDFSVGHDTITLIVTDAHGKTARAFLYVAYYDRINNPPLELLEISSDVRDLRGHTIAFKGNPNNLGLDDVPHGALCYVWSEQTFGGQTTDITSDYMMGWCVSEEININIQFPDIGFEIIGPVPLLDMIAAIPQRIESAITPTNWQETVPAYTNVKGVAAYLFYWHYRTLAELCDIRLLTGETFQNTNQPAFGAADLSGTVAGRQFANLAARLPATFASASDGSIHIIRDPQYHQSRTGTVIRRITLTTDDIVSVRARRSHRLNVAVVSADGFIDNPGGVTGVVPVRSQAPGLTPAQATSNTDLKGMIVRSQAELNWLSGAHWAMMNQPWEFEIELGPNLNVFEPALNYRVAITVRADEFSDPVYGTTYRRILDLPYDPESDMTRNFYVQSVMVDNDGSKQTVTLRVIPELTPTPGVTIPITQPVSYPEPVTNIAPPESPVNSIGFPLELISYETQPSPNAAYIMVQKRYSLANEPIYILSCDDFINSISPTWVLRGTIADIPGNPGETNSYGSTFVINPDDPTRGWLIADDNALVCRYVYKCDNLQKNTQNWIYAGKIINNIVSDPYDGSGAVIVKSKFFPNSIAIPCMDSDASVYFNSVITYSHDNGWFTAQKAPLVTSSFLLSYQNRGADCDKFGNDIILSSVHINVPPFGVGYRIARINNVLGGTPTAATISTSGVGVNTSAGTIVIPYKTLMGGNNTAAQFAVAGIPRTSTLETQGILYTTDGGDLWTNVTPTISSYKIGIPGRCGHAIAISPLTSQKWAVCGYSKENNTARIIISTNAGGTWSTLETKSFLSSPNDQYYYCAESWTDNMGNDIVAFGGFDHLSISDDWSSISSRAGNLTGVVGSNWIVRSIQPVYRGELQ